MQKSVLNILYYGLSDIGLIRNENQDSFGKFPVDEFNLNQNKGLLFIIADGIGGHIGGKEASQSAVDIISSEYFTLNYGIITDALSYAFKKANYEIFKSSVNVPQFQKKGTTCTSLVIENGLAHIAHVGDTRIYRLNGEKIEQLTNDHTQVEELLRKGIITNSEAKDHPSKSILVKALGIEETIEVDIIKDIPLNPGDKFVLCTDGLSKINEEEIKTVVLINSPEYACKKLIALANERGGTDNVTVQVIHTIHDTNVKDFEKNRIEKIKFPRWLTVSILFLIVAVILAFGFIFKNKIVNMFSGESNKAEKNLVETTVNTQTDDAENILNTANAYLETGNLDSALMSYNLILEKIPMHAGALVGKVRLKEKIVEIGDTLLNNNDNENALSYFRKALAIAPNDIKLANKISLIENRLKKPFPRLNSNVENNEHVMKYKEEIKLMDNEEIKLEVKNEIKSFISLDWTFGDLSENDYIINGNGITFLNNSKIKKIISRKTMADIEIEVDMRFQSISSNNSAGIIIGYSISNQSSIESYLLYAVNKKGKFSLFKVKNGQEERLKFVDRSSDFSNSNNELKLKLKCLGPWVILFFNNKLLESWLSKEFIKGKIGLYSGANTCVDFTSCKINSAFENNK